MPKKIIKNKKIKSGTLTNEQSQQPQLFSQRSIQSQQPQLFSQRSIQHEQPQLFSQRSIQHEQINESYPIVNKAINKQLSLQEAKNVFNILNELNLNFEKIYIDLIDRKNLKLIALSEKEKYYKINKASTFIYRNITGYKCMKDCYDSIFNIIINKIKQIIDIEKELQIWIKHINNNDTRIIYNTFEKNKEGKIYLRYLSATRLLDFMKQTNNSILSIFKFPKFNQTNIESQNLNNYKNNINNIGKNKNENILFPYICIINNDDKNIKNKNKNFNECISTDNVFDIQNGISFGINEDSIILLINSIYIVKYALFEYLLYLMMNYEYNKENYDNLDQLITSQNYIIKRISNINIAFALKHSFKNSTLVDIEQDKSLTSISSAFLNFYNSISNSYREFTALFNRNFIGNSLSFDILSLIL